MCGIFVPVERNGSGNLQKRKFNMSVSKYRVYFFFVLLEDGLPVDLHGAGDQTLFGVTTLPFPNGGSRDSRSVESIPLSPGQDHR